VEKRTHEETRAMSKFILHNKAAQDALLRGIDFLADAVKITEGPRGRNVILGQRMLGQSPKCTRDGVTVSNYADPSDPTEQLGADLVREAAQRTDNAVGDGTTASIVLAQAMVHAGFSLIQAGANPMAMERGIHKAADAVIKRLREMAVETTPEKVFQVATVSAHGDIEIGRLVADAVQKAGKDGVVTAEPSSTSDTYIETVVGLELEKSNLISPAFITHPEDMKAELLDCRILLWEGVIATAKSVVPLLKQLNDAHASGGSALLIVAGGYEAEALSCIINNKVGLKLPLIAVRMEAYGDRRKEVMRDIAALTGGKAYTEDLGLKIENVKLSELGQARKVITNMSKTQILGGKGNNAEVAGRVQHIQTCIENVSPAERPLLRHRLAALLGGITVIKVGGVTVTEMEEKKDRVVDAMSAAKAAVESGIVAGGGSALLQASVGLAALKLSRAECVGVAVVHTACQAIAKQIAENAGINGDLMISQLMATPDLGYNAMTDEFENLIESGIIDPVKVVVESLKNAAAVSCSILTMGATVSEKSTERIANV
jgi:chaperonin GroEL